MMSEASQIAARTKRCGSCAVGMAHKPIDLAAVFQREDDWFPGFERLPEGAKISGERPIRAARSASGHDLDVVVDLVALSSNQEGSRA